MTLAEIQAARTPNGGWTRATLAQWGVPWPPPKGWKSQLLSPGSKPAGQDAKQAWGDSPRAGSASENTAISTT
jgi:hypothetical protein